MLWVCASADFVEVSLSRFDDVCSIAGGTCHRCAMRCTLCGGVVRCMSACQFVWAVSTCCVCCDMRDMVPMEVHVCGTHTAGPFTVVALHK